MRGQQRQPKLGLCEAEGSEISKTARVPQVPLGRRLHGAVAGRQAPCSGKPAHKARGKKRKGYGPGLYVGLYGSGL